jgi:hypothetical protein
LGIIGKNIVVVILALFTNFYAKSNKTAKKIGKQILNILHPALGSDFFFFPEKIKTIVA